MESDDAVGKLAFTALTEFMRDRMCMLDGGTGNLISVAGRHYIATCHHVANEFFSSPRYRYATFRKNDRIPKSDLKLLAFKDDELDVALIEILGGKPNYPTYSFDDLELIDTFDSESLKDIAVMLSGTPGELGKEEPDGVYYTPFAFLTLPLEEKLPSSDFLYCKYPTERNVVENRSERKLKLPAAPGLSGAFMLRIKSRTPKEVIWTPGAARVIAVQHRWDSKTYVKGTNIKHLIELIPR